MGQEYLGKEEKEPLISRSTYQLIIFASAIIFLLLPFVSTFNEFLTAVIMRIQLYVFIQDLVVPTLVRMIGAILIIFFGIETMISSQALQLVGAGRTVYLIINWNCIGWQSAILFALTLLTGLQGPYTLKSKLLCVLLGAEGTFLINFFRILSVCLMAFYWGYMPAILFHDYGGTILLLVWLALFWHFSFKHVLKKRVVKVKKVKKRTPSGEGQKLG